MAKSKTKGKVNEKTKDVPVAKPKTPPKKKAAPKKKKEAAAPALKRLDTEKKATKKRAKTTKAKAQPKPKAASKGRKSVEALVQKLDASLPNSLSTQTSSTSVSRGRKSTSPVTPEQENGGWFSKCVIV